MFNVWFFLVILFSFFTFHRRFVQLLIPYFDIVILVVVVIVLVVW